MKDLAILYEWIGDYKKAAKEHLSYAMKKENPMILRMISLENAARLLSMTGDKDGVLQVKKIIDDEFADKPAYQWVSLQISFYARVASKINALPSRVKKAGSIRYSLLPIESGVEARAVSSIELDLDNIISGLSNKLTLEKTGENFFKCRVNEVESILFISPPFMIQARSISTDLSKAEKAAEKLILYIAETLSEKK